MIILAYPHIYCLKHVTDQVNTFNLQERDGKLVRIVISCNLDHINWDTYKNAFLIHLELSSADYNQKCKNLKKYDIC